MLNMGASTVIADPSARLETARGAASDTCSVNANLGASVISDVRPSPESAELLVELYAKMLRIRRFEEAALVQYQKQKIGGFCHLYIGQEATAVGALSCIEDGDKVVTAYRDHGHALAMGIGADAVMAELFGKATGCSKGKGGSMHLFSAARGMLGGNGIVGSHVPVGTGVAFAQKYRGEKKVTLVFFGDGAAQQGAVHESMNMAGLWRLPVVYIIENNRYGMGTSVERSSAVPELYRRAASYNFAGVACDGMDVLDVRAKVSAAVAAARADCAPALIEANTYRYRGHSMSDPDKYRARAEIEGEKKRDPILLLKARLIEQRVDAAMLLQIDAGAKAEAAKAVEFAANSPEPALDELATDVYANPWSGKLLPKLTG